MRLKGKRLRRRFATLDPHRDEPGWQLRGRAGAIGRLGQHCGMTAEQNRNVVEGNRLWDEAGREWTCKRTSWVDAKTASRFFGRSRPVGIYGYDQQIRWIQPDELASFWARV